MSAWSAFFKQMFDFIQKVVPTILAAFVWGYAQAKKKADIAEAKLRAIALKQKYQENKDAVQKELSNRTDDDIASDILSGKLLTNKDDKTNEE